MLERISTEPGLESLVKSAEQVVASELERRNGPTDTAAIPKHGCAFYANDRTYKNEGPSIWCDDSSLSTDAKAAVENFVRAGLVRREGPPFLNSLNFWIRGTYRTGDAHHHLQGTVYQGGLFGFHVAWQLDALFNTAKGLGPLTGN